MLSILEYAKKKKLPRLKIVSIDILNHLQKVSNRNILENNENNTNIIVFDNFVYSEIIGLPNFLFGRTYLVKTARSAYLLAEHGHRAVSVDGELFEPLGSIISADFGSRVTSFSELYCLEIL